MPRVELEGRALPICPYGLDKQPTCHGGFNAASTDPREIDRLWARWPGPLTGVRTGKSSGLAVVDIDTKNNGEAWLAEFECTHGFPSTRVHATRSGGLHFIFKHRPGLNCSRELIARGVDVRADGGAIVWWPAAGCRVLCEGPVMPWPAILDEAIAEGEERRGRKAAESHARYEAALRGKDAPLVIRQDQYRTVPKPLYWKMKGMMRDAPLRNQRRVRGILSVVTEKGEGRNDALYWAGRRLRELIAEKVVSLADAGELLLEAGYASGYVAKDGEGDTIATIKSGLGADPFAEDTRGAFLPEDEEGVAS
jgi:hypothetical protein